MDRIYIVDITTLDVHTGTYEEAEVLINHNTHFAYDKFETLQKFLREAFKKRYKYHAKQAQKIEDKLNYWGNITEEKFNEK